MSNFHLHLKNMQHQYYINRNATISLHIVFFSYTRGEVSVSSIVSIGSKKSRDIKLNSFKTNVTLNLWQSLQNFITTKHRKSDESKDHLKLTELDVVTMCQTGTVYGVLSVHMLFSIPVWSKR
jgi:hypothetical protein